MPKIRKLCLCIHQIKYITLVVLFVIIFLFTCHLKPDPVTKHNLIIGIGIPKTGGNKMDSMVSESFNLTSCNKLWANLPSPKIPTARAAIYCANGATIAHPQVKKDVLKRFGTECSYLGTHQDITIGRQLKGLEVSYVTQLRDPINRLVSGCNYHLGKKCSYKTIVKFAKADRTYGLPNRMTKIIAGMDPMCSLEPKQAELSDEALLEKAKSNLRDKFIFVGILERLAESKSLLPSTVKDDVILPRQASKGGTFKGERDKLIKLLGPYIDLDQKLYHYGNKLLDAKLKKSLFNNFPFFFQRV